MERFVFTAIISLRGKANRVDSIFGPAKELGTMHRFVPFSVSLPERNIAARARRLAYLTARAITPLINHGLLKNDPLYSSLRFVSKAS